MGRDSPMTFHKGRATDAIFDSKLPALQKLIMLCYIKHANAKGIAWPGGDRLAKMTSTSPTSIKRHRRALMRAGVLIKIEGGDGSVYRFVINLNNIPSGVTEVPEYSQGRRHREYTQIAFGRIRGRRDQHRANSIGLAGNDGNQQGLRGIVAPIETHPMADINDSSADEELLT